MKWWPAVTLGVAVLTALSLLTVPPASSATKRWSKVAVSLDGRAWSDHLRKPLFDRGVEWVPGDQRTRSFYVRNRSGEKARLRLVVRMSDRSKMLRKGAFRFEAKLNKHWKRVTRAGSRRLAQLVVRPRAVKKVWVRVRMSPAAGNDAMNRQLRFRIRLRLTSRAG